MSNDGEVKCLVHDTWEVRIYLDKVQPEALVSGHADLLHLGEPRCRIVLAGRFEDPRGACEALERKAKSWVDDWMARDHSGETGFASL